MAISSPDPPNVARSEHRFPISSQNSLEYQWGRGYVLRGGSWNNNARNTRSANRNRNRRDNRNNNSGFRLVLSGSTPYGQN
ncbi:MAG: SUMF1/EgtB/PvdO family nonheme iron enzyme [Prochlorotrichaceae cyanobacterium]